MANERRLIDKNVLIHAIGDYMATNAYLNDTALDVLKVIARWVDEATTIDAVEVGFCKDCKHMETLPNNLRWCNAWGRFNGAGDDGYCNYGEKRESGTQTQREDV